MKPEDIPPELKKMLDEAAGKEHSATGSVMTALAEILTAHEESWMPVVESLRGQLRHSRQVVETLRRLVQEYQGLLMTPTGSGTKLKELWQELAALNCPCCVFGNHTEVCSCDGVNCCHPENHEE